MTLKEFFIGRTKVFFALLVIIGGVVVYTVYHTPEKEAEVPSTTYTQTTAPVAFAWRYEKANSLNPDGNLNTDVFIDITYADGSRGSTFVALSHGGCADLPDSKEERVAGTHVAQCYGAGLGYYFKITKGESSYRVERKMFEEGSPEYNPPEQPYEVILEIPLSQS